MADTAAQEQSEAARRIAELRATTEARRLLPRDVRRIARHLQVLPTTEQRPIIDAIDRADQDALRTMVADIEQRDSDRTDIAVMLRGLLMTLRTLPTALLAVVAQLVNLTGSDQPPHATYARPPDRPVPRQARPARVARCPHGPDVLAVGRTRHRAGRPALRAA